MLMGNSGHLLHLRCAAISCTCLMETACACKCLCKFFILCLSFCKTFCGVAEFPLPKWPTSTATACALLAYPEALIAADTFPAKTTIEAAKTLYKRRCTFGENRCIFELCGP